MVTTSGSVPKDGSVRRGRITDPHAAMWGGNGYVAADVPSAGTEKRVHLSVVGGGGVGGWCRSKDHDLK